MISLIFITFNLFAICTFGQVQSGYFDFEWNEKLGSLVLEIEKSKIGERFLYASGLTSGIGSNDIGLDRGQLGSQNVVSFYRSGDKILLIADNLEFRAESDNIEEKKSVDEAFAKSVIWGFKIINEDDSKIKIKLNDFLLRDAHNVAQTLAKKDQGSYKVDKNLSGIYKEGLLNFPNNSEFEALITFKGVAKGNHIKSVTPMPNQVSVRQHHSFIKLPDDNFKPRVFSPECGFIKMSYYDYATPIEKQLEKKFIIKHRLEKRNPNAQKSEPIDPIIYYLDRGCPEPVKSALLDGAAWWNEAFEAAGFINAFRVEVMPDDMHPLDVRYNVIQWVHRSTRGWSYGGSIKDPRTGEILKGHVSLGSLRVRQDYLIAQGIVSSFNDNFEDPRLMELALARLRQLSAHEVGHTIGLTHNFASSYNDRASVMDYPHPLVQLTKDGNLDFSISYDVGIGEWDKRAIIYGYSSVPNNISEQEYLDELIEENHKNGLKFITDQDARPIGGLHPYAHLWDNGKDPVSELNRMGELRTFALNRMGTNSIPEGVPYSEIEKVLVPVYLMHRYQIEAVSKIIGGIDFSYQVKGSGENQPYQWVDEEKQKEALGAILNTMSVKALQLPESLVALIPPPAYGYSRDRESFKGYTGSLLDPLAIAEALANHSMQFLMDPQRLSRIYLNRNEDWNLHNYFEVIRNSIDRQLKINIQYGVMLEKVFFFQLIKLVNNSKTNKQVSASALGQLAEFKLKTNIEELSESDHIIYADHRLYLSNWLANYKNEGSSLTLPTIMQMPPGSPIGCH